MKNHSKMRGEGFQIHFDSLGLPWGVLGSSLVPLRGPLGSLGVGKWEFEGPLGGPMGGPVGRGPLKDPWGSLGVPWIPWAP